MLLIDSVQSGIVIGYISMWAYSRRLR